MKFLSDEYQQLLNEEHANTNWGATSHRWGAAVRKWLRGRKAKTLLDYGCGKGALKSELEGLDVREYDPGVPGKEALPEPAQYVVCLDVLEHIEPEFLDAVLDHMNGLAQRGIFAVIALYQGGRKLADGRPAHLIVQSQEWWEEKLRAHWTGSLAFERVQVPGRNPAKRTRECLVVRLEKSQ